MGSKPNIDGVLDGGIERTEGAPAAPRPVVARLDNAFITHSLIGLSPATSPLYPARYDMLNAWRGVAALMVVLCHVALLDTGFYGVMLFFVISGYCVTAAAEACARKELGFRQFMWRRVRRIFPPYLLSIAFFYATRVVRGAAGGKLFHRSALEWVENLSLTQWLALVRHPMGNAFDNPTLFVTASWSLCYEEQFYLIMGLLMLMAGALHRRNTVIVLALVTLAWNWHCPHIVCGLFLDYWPHFAIGSLLYYRLCCMCRRISRRLTDAALIGLLGVSIMMAWQEMSVPANGRPLWKELFVTTLFSLLLIILRPLDGIFKLSLIGRMTMTLGLISYSLYLIHQFNLHMIRSIVLKACPTGTWRGITFTMQVCLHVVLAAAFWFCCERPFVNRAIVPDPDH